MNPFRLSVAAALLAIGAVGGYLFAQARQPPPLPALQPAGPVVTSPEARAEADAVDDRARAGGWRLIGTLKASGAAQSRAWLVPPGSDTATAYATGDALPGGLRVETITDNAVRLADAQGSLLLPRTGGTPESLVPPSAPAAAPPPKRAADPRQAEGIAPMRTPEIANPRRNAPRLQPHLRRKLSGALGTDLEPPDLPPDAPDDADRGDAPD